MDHRLTRFVPVFVMLAQAPIIRQPRERPLDHPTLRQQLEPLHVVVPLDDLQDPLAARGDPGDQLPRVATVGPDPFHSRPRAGQLRPGEDQFGAVAVLNVRRMDHGRQHPPLRIHQDVPLDSGDFFSPRRSPARRWSVSL